MIDDVFGTAAEAARQPLTRMPDVAPEVVMAVALREAARVLAGTTEADAYLKLAAALDPPDAEGNVNLWDPDA